MRVCYQKGGEFISPFGGEFIVALTRSELKNKNKTFPNQLRKPIQNPTARWVFENFFAIHLLILNNQEQIVGLEDKHRLILELLGGNYMGFYGINGGGGAK